MDKQERIAFFHEDDYCQREILPLAAKSFCLRQIKEINDFSKMHRAANGLYTDIYIREKPTHVIEELRLRSERLQEALRFLPPYDLVETGYDLADYVIDEAEGTYGRGNDGHRENVFWSVNESEIVNAIWLDIRIDENTIDLQRRVLTSLGKIAPVLLADWNLNRCVDLTDLSDIEKYLSEIEEYIKVARLMWLDETKGNGTVSGDGEDNEKETSSTH